MQSTSSSDRNYFGRQNHGTQIGQVYGTFNQVYVSAEDADRLLPLNLNSPGTAQQTKPSSLIPFSRNPDFVHRGDLLNRIDKAFSNPTAHNRLALWGLGGVGKSELGIEYAHRVAERFSDAPIWIFWINACTRSRVLEGFRAIAEAVNLPGKDRSEDLPLLVHNWLSNKNNGKWFIILDSADDVKVFFDPNGSAQTQGSANEPLGRFFPQSHHGAILITTRFRDLARRIVDPVHGILEVSTMSDAESVELLEKKLGYLPERKVAADLVEELGCVPLAISQAAAYILARAPLVSPESYLAQLRAGERERSRLLADDLGDWRRDRSSNAVFATWSISFAYIQVERPSAAEVLYLMSFYDPYGIPKWFLTGTDHPSHDVNTDGIPRRNLRWNRISDILRFLRQLELIPRPKPFSTIDIDADISMLRDYALISVKEPGGVFSMHPLVQASTRFWLKHCRLYDKFEKVFVDTIATWFVWESDICEYEWVLQRALPHIQAAFSHNASIVSSIFLEIGRLSIEPIESLSVIPDLASISLSVVAVLSDYVGEFYGATLLDPRTAQNIVLPSSIWVTLRVLQYYRLYLEDSPERWLRQFLESNQTSQQSATPQRSMNWSRFRDWVLTHVCGDIIFSVSLRIYVASFILMIYFVVKDQWV